MVTDELPPDTDACHAPSPARVLPHGESNSPLSGGRAGRRFGTVQRRRYKCGGARAVADVLCRVANLDRLPGSLRPGLRTCSRGRPLGLVKRQPCSARNWLGGIPVARLNATVMY